jgi:hypothetical protein
MKISNELLNELTEWPDHTFRLIAFCNRFGYDPSTVAFRPSKDDQDEQGS